MSVASPIQASKGALLWVTLLLSLYVVFILNLVYEVLRFSFEPLNYIFFLVILCIPLLLLVMSFRLRRTSWKVLIIPCLLPLLLVSAGLVVFTMMVIPDVIKEGQPAFRRRVRTVPSDHYNLGIYYSDAVVTIRQERGLLPGILLVRWVYLTPGYDVQVEVVDADRIKVTSIIDPAESGGKILTLKRFVYL